MTFPALFFLFLPNTGQAKGSTAWEDRTRGIWVKTWLLLRGWRTWWRSAPDCSRYRNLFLSCFQNWTYTIWPKVCKHRTFICWVRGSGVRSAFQLIPRVFSGVDIEFFYSSIKLNTPCLSETWFGPKRNYNPANNHANRIAFTTRWRILMMPRPLMAWSSGKRC